MPRILAYVATWAQGEAVAGLCLTILQCAIIWPREGVTVRYISDFVSADLKEKMVFIGVCVISPWELFLSPTWLKAHERV